MPISEILEGAAIEQIADLAMAASKPEIIIIHTDGLGAGLPAKVPVLFNRQTQQVIPLLEHIEAARPPIERKGTAKVTTLASFIDLSNRHKTGKSVIFGKTAWPDPKLTTVLDYFDSQEEATFGKHRVEYSFPLTEEFKAWIDNNGLEMDQVTFAAFLENHAAELASPFPGEKSEFEQLFKERFAEPNELITLSRELEVFQSAKVKQSTRLQSGERQVIFTTEHQTSSGEKVDIPGIFMVSVAPFVSGDREAPTVRIPARIRYRLKDGAIKWFYQLYRWQFWLRERVQQDLAEAAKETALPAYEGAPEMGA
ncbi:hypothetical protein GCM10007301_15120 [Azorhizobium oxalatiphilum]|uniref:DUF2303 family protein n=1 Tax=Azorhizobium oxalatiphilum TaxID=980631 RepID=A0A917BT50_9HYPH|nr:DUF2303 family protein [Azorhizobium oxalatiphilum]GGF56444.1 hypothetical protein GCM10007301_15120 [Azorhizobium oxalatiphilum]